MKMLLTLAWRNIWRNPVRSAVIIFSVVLGLWAGTFINALYWGMSEDRVRIAIENEVSHIQIHHPKFSDEYRAAFSIQIDSLLLKTLKAQPDIRAYSLRSQAQAMLTTPGSSTGILVNGIDAVAEDSTTHLSSKVIDGKYPDGSKRNQILIGNKLAKKLKLKVKSKVVLSCLDTADNISSAAFKVAGIFESNNSNWDGINVFVQRGELNTMLGLQNEAHQVAVLLNSNRELKENQMAMQKALPSLKVETWQQISPETDLIISSMSQFSVIFIVIILLALSFGIVNTMLMAILERSREIGMIIALGMNRIKIFFLILFETFMLVMIGCPIGLFIAWLSIQYFSKYGIDISSFSSKAMSSFGFGTVIYPSLPFQLYLQIVLLVVIAAVISSVAPAIKALKINPAETLKQ